MCLRESACVGVHLSAYVWLGQSRGQSQFHYSDTFPFTLTLDFWLTRNFTIYASLARSPRDQPVSATVLSPSLGCQMPIITYVFIGLFVCLFLGIRTLVSTLLSKVLYQLSHLLGPYIVFWSKFPITIYNWGNGVLQSFDNHLRVCSLTFRPSQCF